MESTAKKADIYTVEEYLSLPESDRNNTELIDGGIVALAAPAFVHQDISIETAHVIRSYIRRNGGKCRAYENGNVKLGGDTLVQPDVFVGCRPELFDEVKYNGAPDLAIEIVSSDRMADFFTKLELYKRYGVREYWIIDPKYSQTTVYYFEENIAAEIYPFDKAVPVNIFKNSAEPLTVTNAEMLDQK
jgi:Uma2 family endonuclease